MNAHARAIIPVDFDDMKTGFQSGKAAALADWAFRREQRDFEALVNRLRVKRWNKANPEKRKAVADRYRLSPHGKAQQRQRERERRRARWLATNPVVTCGDCGVQFCPAQPSRGVFKRTYCTSNCEARARYQRNHPGAKRRPRRAA